MRNRGFVPRLLASALLLGAAAAVMRPAVAQEGAPRLTYYPSLQLKFRNAQARNYFILHSGLVNASGAPLSDLVVRQRFPEGFTARVISANDRAALHRVEGFSEQLEAGLYTMKMPALRVAEAAAVVVELTYEGRPAAVPFPPMEVEYTENGQRRAEKGPELQWDLSKYTKYAGTLREYIKRYAGLDMKIPLENADWGFNNAASRAAGRIATGPVEIENDPSGRLRFSLQAGTPGDLRQMMVVRRPLAGSRQPAASDEVRRMVMDMVGSISDFTLDPDDFSVKKGKVGRLDSWVAQTRWRDRVKDRLGEGPSRWYIFSDDKSQFIINISAQGRGAGPDKAGTPNAEKENALMAELEGIVTSLRIL